MQGRVRQTKGEVYFLLWADKAAFHTFYPDAFFPAQPRSSSAQGRWHSRSGGLVPAWGQGQPLGLGNPKEQLHSPRCCHPGHRGVCPKPRQSELPRLRGGDRRTGTPGQQGWNIYSPPQQQEQARYQLINQSQKYVRKSFNKQKKGWLWPSGSASAALFFFPVLFPTLLRNSLHTGEENAFQRSPGEPQDGAAEIGVIITKISPKLSMGIHQTLKCTYS